VKIGAVIFSDHALDRGHERDVSVEEMVQTVLRGRVLSERETYVVRRGRRTFDEERVTFTHEFKADRKRTVGVVGGVADDSPDVVVVTCFVKGRK
jgi:hypothetical protein